MKRRSFLKALAGAAASLFLPSGSAQAVRTPDEIAFAERNVLFPDAHGREFTHVHDYLQYTISRHGWSDEDRDYLRGDQWGSSEIKRMASRQRELNLHRSRTLEAINTIKPLKFNKIPRLSFDKYKYKRIK